MAVQQLNEIFIKASDQQLSPTPKVESTRLTSTTGSLTFVYPWRSYPPDRIVKLRTSLNSGELHETLAYALFQGKEGELSFEIQSVEVRTSGERGVIIKVNYTYIVKLEDTYFSILPTDLYPIIVSKVNTLNDAKSVFLTLSTHTSPSFWREVFKYRFPAVYQGYVSLNYTDYMTMNAYLSFLYFERRRGTMIKGYISNNFLDYYSIFAISKRDLQNLGLTSDDMLTMGKVILYVRHPRTYQVVSKDLYLKDNFNAISKLLLFDIGEPEDYIQDILTNDKNVDTNWILENFDTLFEDLQGYIEENSDVVVYTFLLLLDFKESGSPTEILNILDVVGTIDEGINLFEEDPKYVELSHQIGKYPILRLYFSKIKQENEKLSQLIINKCKEGTINDVCESIKWIIENQSI